MSLLFSSFSKGRKKVYKNFEQLKGLPSFARFCKHLKMEPETLLAVLLLSFNQVGYEELSDVLSTLKISVFNTIYIPLI
jgi:hypothetical protein